MSFIEPELARWVRAMLDGEVIESQYITTWCEVTSLYDLINAHVSCISLRIRPKTLTLAGVEFPEPLRVAPEQGVKVWVADAPSPCLNFILLWRGTTDQIHILRAGLLQATRQGARDQARAMILSVGGSIEKGV